MPETPTDPASKPAPRVASFESRMSGPMADLIRKAGGIPVEAPALREVPLGGNPQAVRFARALISGEFDLVIFTTGVGARYLAEEIATEVPRDEFLAALNLSTVV